MPDSSWFSETINHDGTAEIARRLAARTERGYQWLREQAKSLPYEVDKVRFRLMDRDLLRGGFVHHARVVAEMDCDLRMFDQSA